MKTIHTALAALLALASIASSAQRAAPPQPPVPRASTSPQEHQAAVRRLLETMELGPVTRYHMRNTPKDNLEGWELAQHMADHVSQEDIYRHLVPVYAKHLSADTADSVAAYYRTSIGRRQLIAAWTRSGIMKGDAAPLFSPAEIRVIKQFEATPAALQFIAAQKAITADNGAMAAAWSREYSAQIQSEMQQSLAELVQAARERQPGDTSPLPELMKSGLPTFDKIMAIAVDATVTISQANQSLRQDLRDAGAHGVLQPANLVTAEGIQRSRTSLLKADERIALYLHQMEDMQQEFRRRFVAVMPAKASVNEFERSIGRQYDRLVRLGENQRKLLDTYERVIAFAESRLGSSELSGNVIQFRNDDDVQKYNGLIAQVETLIKEEAELNAEGTRAMNKAQDQKGS
jgi:hypothetical protein